MEIEQIISTLQEKNKSYTSDDRISLTNQLVKALQNITQIEEKLAKAILETYNQEAFIAEEKGVVFFLVARLISYKLPKLSYEYTLKAFKIYPKLTEKFNIQPSYVYQEVEEEICHSCPICGSKEIQPYYNALVIAAINFESIFSPSRLWCKCNECDNLFVYNFPKHCQTDNAYKGSNMISAIGQAILVPRVSPSIFSDLINKIRGFEKGNKYLEVGVGTGDFIAVAREMGIEIDAVELMPSFCKQVEELLDFKPICCDFLAFETNQKYDVISMGDIIEHVKAPRLALEKANELLKNGGILWISTPNFKSSYGQMMKFSDPMWNEPWHRVYFCYQSFKTLLAEMGFEVLEYRASNRYNGSMELLTRKYKTLDK